MDRAAASLYTGFGRLQVRAERIGTCTPARASLEIAAVHYRTVTVLPSYGPYSGRSFL